MTLVCNHVADAIDADEPLRARPVQDWLIPGSIWLCEPCRAARSRHAPDEVAGGWSHGMTGACGPCFDAWVERFDVPLSL